MDSKPKVNRKTNWAGNETWCCQETVCPASLQELQDCVRYSEKHNIKIKAIGAAHSFSDCAATSGIQIDLKHLNKIISFNPRTKVIEAEAGIRLKDLYLFFNNNNVALPSIPNVDEITLGGAISNATHGTNIFYGTYSSLVREIKLVTANGEMLQLQDDARNTKGQQRFEAALASFGALGIFYSITLKLEESYDVLVQRYSTALKDINDEIESLARKHDGVQFMLFPLQGLAFIKTQDKIRCGLQPYSKQSIRSIWVFESILWMFKPKRWQLLTKLFQKVFNSKIFLSILRKLYNSSNVTNWSDGELSRHKSRFFNMEYAIPISRVKEALDAIFHTTQEFNHTGAYIRCLPFILRPVGADTLGFLSPTYQRDTCYIDILFQAADSNEISFYAQLEKDLLRVDGRVSWSRKFFASSEDILQRYSHHTKFLDVMEELDPKGIFVNSFVSRIFESGSKQSPH